MTTTTSSTSTSSILRLTTLSQNQSRIISRIDELELLLSSPSTSIIQSRKAAVELSQLQQQIHKGSSTARRASIDELNVKAAVACQLSQQQSQQQQQAPHYEEQQVKKEESSNNNNGGGGCRRASVSELRGVGVVTKNRANLNAQIEERLRREEEIRQLLEQLHNASGAERLRLEELLRAARLALKDMDGDSSTVGTSSSSVRFSAASSSVPYDNNVDISYPPDEYVGAVSLKVNHNGGEDESGLRSPTMETMEATSDDDDDEADNDDDEDEVSPLDISDVPDLPNRIPAHDLKRLSTIADDSSCASSMNESMLSIEMMEAAYQRAHSIHDEYDDDDDDEDSSAARVRALEGRVEELVGEIKDQEREHAAVHEEFVKEVNKAADIIGGMSDDGMNMGTDGAKPCLEVQLRLAQEAIDAIIALDHDRIQENENIKQMTAQQDVNSGRRLEALESLVAQLEGAMLQHDPTQREFAMQMTEILGDRIKELDNHVANLVGDAGDEGGDETQSLQYWKTKAERLEAKCFSLEGDLEESDTIIIELKEWKRLHEERMAALQGQQHEVAQDAPGAGRPNRRPSLVQQQRRGSRRLSFQASIDPAFSAQLKRASHSSSGDLNKQMREEAKINMAALEERLKDIAGERSELLNELDTMKALLAAADGEKKSGKVTERLVYQLSCKKCNKLSSCVGTTHDDLKTTMGRHFNEVYEYMQSGKKNKSDDSKKNKSDGGGKNKSDGGGSPKSVKSSDSNTSRGKTGCWNAQFAAHFAKHCKPAIKFKSVSKKDVIAFCRQYVKIEVLKRSDGAELYWEDHE